MIGFGQNLHLLKDVGLVELDVMGSEPARAGMTESEPTLSFLNIAFEPIEPLREPHR